MVDNVAPPPVPVAAGPAAPPWLRHAVIVLLRHAASAVLILGLLWTVARPHAQEFIEETVNDRLELLEQQMNDVRQSVRDQERVQDVMQNDIGHIKKDQDETRRNTRMILQSLNGMRSESQVGMMLPSLRLFTIHTAASIAERFRHRIAEWQLAGAMAVSGLILLRPGDTFDLPPYAVVREIATEETWGTIFLLTGLARVAALAVNGSMPRGSSLVRAGLAMLCAFFWVTLLSGYLSMGTPTLMTGMLAGAFVTEFVNIYRAAGDTRTANNGNGNGGGHGKSG